MTGTVERGAALGGGAIQAAALQGAGTDALPTPIQILPTHLQDNLGPVKASAADSFRTPSRLNTAPSSLAEFPESQPLCAVSMYGFANSSSIKLERKSGKLKTTASIRPFGGPK